MLAAAEAMRTERPGTRETTRSRLISLQNSKKRRINNLKTRIEYILIFESFTVSHFRLGKLHDYSLTQFSAKKKRVKARINYPA